MAELPPNAPERARFGDCPSCAYVTTGSAEFCFNCSRESIEHVASSRCVTCDQKLPASGACGNPLCNRSIDRRGWEFIWAIAMRSGSLKNTITAYKYDNVKGWAWIFGRILVGYLERKDQTFEEFDVIIPMPTYVGPEPEARSWDHVATIIERAEIEGPHWPFRRDVMTKTAMTPTMAGLPFGQRAQMAETQLRPALQVSDPAAVAGKLVLVFDDVFTAGLTLREVAFKLKAAGAAGVAGIVLARQPY